MAVKIRLQRIGKRDIPIYKIVAVDESKKRDGKVKDFLGLYQPETKPAVIKIDKNKLEKWLSLGAKPTEAVRKLLSP